jgi:hypothetical protein
MSKFKKYWVSFFETLKNINPATSIDIEEIFTFIKNGKWKKEIDECQLDLSKKKNLPCFTPTGLFSQRNSLGIIKFSGLICLDIDNVDDPKSLKEICKNISWVWVAFITPSRKGLKIIVQTNADVEFFHSTEAEVAISFYEITGFLRDEKCKDLARVQFVSHDADIYINNKPTIFKKRSH